MLELAHTGLLDDRQEQWQRRQKVSHRHGALFVIPIGQDLRLEKKAMRGRIAPPKLSVRNSLSHQFSFRDSFRSAHASSRRFVCYRWGFSNCFLTWSFS